MSLYKCKMYVSRVETIWESLSFHLITWLPIFNVPQFIGKLIIPPNYRLHRRWRFNEGALYIYLPPPLPSCSFTDLLYTKGVNYLIFVFTCSPPPPLTLSTYCTPRVLMIWSLNLYAPPPVALMFFFSDINSFDCIRCSWIKSKHWLMYFVSNLIKCRRLV